MDLKVKIITGYRQDQYETIDADEAHKAYYLFLNPEKRGIFSNGVALRGKDIQRIAPDYQATMGWNPIYNLRPEDMNRIQAKGVDSKLRNILGRAKGVALSGDESLLSLPLSEAEKEIRKIPKKKEGGLLKSGKEENDDQV